MKPSLFNSSYRPAQKPIILTATYAVVIFSIVVQGLTLAPLVRKVVTTRK